MNDAQKEIHHLKGEHLEGFSNCGVSCNGTWQKRGHSSLNGCVAVLSIDTGKCLDFEVLRKVCQTCQRHETNNDLQAEQEWQINHAPKCKPNFNGSASSMETEGAKRILERSEEKHKLRYTEYYGDGDSKGFNGMEKGFGGKGKLTDRMIDKLQNHYGIAIRSNVGKLSEMKKAIYASLMHCSSSKDRNLHYYCPKGADIWCRFNRDLANGTTLFKPGPGLPLEIIAQLKPIYLRLSDDALLTRCLDGKTQNQNEAINGMIWDRVPKEVFVGADIVELGVNDAVSHFNIGSQAALDTLTNSGIEPGEFCLEEMKGIDKLRLGKAVYKGRDTYKRKTKLL